MLSVVADCRPVCMSALSFALSRSLKVLCSVKETRFDGLNRQLLSFIFFFLEDDCFVHVANYNAESF